MGRSNSVMAVLALGVLLILIVPGGMAARDPPIPDEVTQTRDEAVNAANNAVGQAENEAAKAADEAQGNAGDARQKATDVKHGAARLLMDQVTASLTASQQLLAHVSNLAQATADAIVLLAQELVQHVLDRGQSPADQFKPGGERHGDVSVQTDGNAATFTPQEAGLAMAVAAAGASGALLYFIVLQRAFLFGLIPLLSRIAHNEIYNNEARRKIADLVVSEPGFCLNELVERTGYSRNAVSYHLFVLEKEEELVSIKDGKYRRYFARSGKYVNGAKNVVSALRNPTTLKMAQHVVGNPGTIQRELCLLLGTTASAACWHAKRLEDLHVIRKERVANTVQYYPGEAMLKYDLSEFGLKHAGAPVPAMAGPAMPMA